MKLDHGFSIDRPGITVPWRSTPSELLKLLEADDRMNGGVRKITGSYYTVAGEALGIETAIGFHFRSDALDQIELFDPNQSDLQTGFARYQAALVREFGEPTRSIGMRDEYPAHEWILHPFRILHFTQERFGPEPHLRILGPGSSFAYDPFARLI
jgi:hypothetical protein